MNEVKASTVKLTSLRLAALSGVMAAALAGCRTATIDDPALSVAVQKAIVEDGSLVPQNVQVIAQAGVVTLTGAVDNAAARSLAARDAAAVPGVVKVVNDITVASEGAQPPQPAVSVKTPARPQPKPSPVPAQRGMPAPKPTLAPAPQQNAVLSAAPITRTPPGPSQPLTPLPPVARTVTLPAGSALPVRVTQSLDSATTQPGDSFSGAVASDIVIDGMVMIPRGAPVTGRVTEVHEAAHFKGSALLTVELTGLTSRGEHIPLSTQPYTVQGKGRGENTAVKTGVGAAAGAILGGIFGGGKGAAIGAAAGGGTGAGINAVTRGQQVQIPSETIVRFVTTDSIATRTSVHSGTYPDDPSLQSR